MSNLPPLLARQFKVNAGNLTEITQNTESVTLDFATKSIKLVVRQAATASSIEQAYLFAGAPIFDVEAFDDHDGLLFGVKPIGIKLEDHSFALSYRATGSLAVHEYVFSYQGLVFGEPVLVDSDEIQEIDTSFPPVTGVLDLSKFAVEQVELDDEQESRFTPDNPDTDGDGVPDKLDQHPLDPTKQ